MFFGSALVTGDFQVLEVLADGSVSHQSVAIAGRVMVQSTQCQHDETVWSTFKLVLKDMVHPRCIQYSPMIYNSNYMLSN